MTSTEVTTSSTRIKICRPIWISRSASGLVIRRVGEFRDEAWVMRVTWVMWSCGQLGVSLNCTFGAEGSLLVGFVGASWQGVELGGGAGGGSVTGLAAAEGLEAGGGRGGQGALLLKGRSGHNWSGVLELGFADVGAGRVRVAVGGRGGHQLGGPHQTLAGDVLAQTTIGSGYHGSHLNCILDSIFRPCCKL